MELDDLLDMPTNLTNTTVLLYSRSHVIRRSQEIVLLNLYNVSFEGEENNTVFITCSEGYGLAFLMLQIFTWLTLLLIDAVFQVLCLSKVACLFNDLVRLSFVILNVLKIGLFVGVATNLMLENIVVANTSGIGPVQIAARSIPSHFLSS